MRCSYDFDFGRLESAFTCHEFRPQTKERSFPHNSKRIRKTGRELSIHSLKQKLVLFSWVFSTQDLAGGSSTSCFSFVCNNSYKSEAARMVTKPFTVDLDKPLVFQVGHLGEAYDKWVHQPIVSKDGPRFFANDFCERLTRTKWWVIPLVWLPVVCWVVSISIQRGLTPTEAASAVAGGVFVWTFLEYSLHRFLFHMKTTSYWGNTLHYLLHGCHHKHPLDGLRLVFPPAATAILCVPVWTMFKLLSPSSMSPALFGGGLLGYVIYDCTHYYLHHGKPSKGYSQNLKRYHLNHHFKVQSKGFGITSSVWDHLFGTYPATKEGDKSR